MSKKPDLRLWPSGETQWAEFAAKIDDEKATSAKALWRSRATEEPPPTPEEEETLF